ncbi:hypothetical protein GGR57DRAFT_504855 [Xylariaceae sp. FL1272]|nr:hypothetical protein GGR57DRAFT_504855 [Xylariaceae sp. FL1272]
MHHLNQKATTGLTTGIIVTVLLTALAIHLILRLRKTERTKKLKEEANTARHSVLVPFAEVAHLKVHRQQHDEKGQLIRNQSDNMSGSGSEERSRFDEGKSDGEKTARQMQTSMGSEASSLDVRPSTAMTGTSSGASFTTCDTR